MGDNEGLTAPAAGGRHCGALGPPTTATSCLLLPRLSARFIPQLPATKLTYVLPNLPIAFGQTVASPAFARKLLGT